MKLQIMRGAGNVIELPASRLVIYSDAGTVLAVVHEHTTTGWTMVTADEPEKLAETIRMLGINKTVIVRQQSIERPDGFQMRF